MTNQNDVVVDSGNQQTAIDLKKKDIEGPKPAAEANGVVVVGANEVCGDVESGVQKDKGAEVSQESEEQLQESQNVDHKPVPKIPLDQG